MRQTSFVKVIGTVTLITFSALAAEKISLDQAITMAYQHRPSLKGFEYSTIAARIRQNQTLSGYLPHFHITGQVKAARASRGTFSNFTFVGEQLVYSFAGPLDLYSIARKDRHIAEIAVRAHRDLIRNETEITFLNSWLLQRQLKQVLTNAFATRTNFEREKLKNKVQLLDRNDWLKSNVVYAQRVADSSIYENATVQAQSDLERVLGIGLKGSLRPVLDKSDTPVASLVLQWKPHSRVMLLPKEEYRILALENRKELKIKQKEIERENRTRVFNLKKYLPSFSLFGTVQSDALTFPNTPAYHELGGRMDWDLFDGLANFQEARIAHTRMLRSQMEKQSIVQDVENQVRVAFEGVHKELKLLAVQRTQLLQGRNEIDLRRQEKQTGLITQVELDEAEFRYKNAEFSWLAQRTNVAVAMSNLHFACGYPAELAAL